MAQPLSSEGPRTGRNGYVIPAFLGVPQKGNKIRRGYITLAFSGVQKRAKFSGAQKWAE